MKNLINGIIIFSSALTFLACDANVLDVQPVDQVPSQIVWNDPSLASAFVRDIYPEMGHGLGMVELSGMSDEAQFVQGWGTAKIVQATINPSDLGGFVYNEDMASFYWDDLYSAIRKCNIFFDKINGSDIDDDLKNRLKGEAHFLRAYFYQNLMRMYGGVPITTKAYKLGDDMTIARNTFGETINFIVDEADSAADLLPMKYPTDDIGLATKGAALALKSRTLLYAASDLYHVNPSGMAETGYTKQQDRQAFWRNAKNAAQDVIDLGKYSLFRGDPAPGDSTAQNYHELFLTPMPDNPEVIMQRYFIKTRGDGYNPGLYDGPNGYHNWGGNAPIQSLVDDYEMKDGSKFDWDASNEAAHPYENRDPRFYATILYDGAKWRPRPTDTKSIDPQGIIQSFRLLTFPDGSTVPGLDTRQGPIEDWNGSRTGYYLRKWIRSDVAHTNNVKQEGPWFYFRYAEILLNYAEASIELGQEGDARSTLNEIRRRAGMPEFDASVTGQELMDKYRNERRIEMAYEEQRYFDVRRWMIAPAVLNKDADGIDIYVKGTAQGDRSTYHDYEYKVNHHVQQRSWDDKMYFAPISLEEMNRNDKLVQNPGY